MTLGAFAALGALVLLPSFGATAPDATPAPSPAAAVVPCGFVTFIPAGAPRFVNGTAYERIKTTVSFSDGHTETAEFPYYWVYPNGELTDPWSSTNLRRGDFAVTMQLPPAGTDVTTFPVLIQYVLKHTTRDGNTDLRACTGPRKGFDIPTGLDRARSPAPPPAWLPFVDDTPRDAPVTIVEATTFPNLSSFSSKGNIVNACVTFWNRSPQTVEAIRFTFTYFDAAGKLSTIQALDRYGWFAPGAVVEGVRRDRSPARADNETRKNCRLMGVNGELGVNHVAVTAVEFIDHATWPPGTPSAWPPP
jgi:hypothetical protein